MSQSPAANPTKAVNPGFPSKSSSSSNDAPSPAKGSAQGAAAPRSKKLIVLLISVLLLAAAGGAAWYFMDNAPTGAAEGAPVPAAAEKPAEKPKPSLFVALETFTVNLQPDQGRHQYLQVNVTLNVADRSVETVLKQLMPEVRNRVLLILSSARASEIYAVEGKQKLAGAIQASLNEIVARVEGKEPPSADKSPQSGPGSAGDGAPVMSVYFTSFVIQ